MFLRKKMSRLWHFMTDKPKWHDCFDYQPPPTEPGVPVLLPPQSVEEIVKIVDMYVCGHIDGYRVRRYLKSLLMGETAAEVVAQAIAIALKKRPSAVIELSISGDADPAQVRAAVTAALRR